MEGLNSNVYSKSDVISGLILLSFTVFAGICFGIYTSSWAFGFGTFFALVFLGRAK